MKKVIILLIFILKFNFSFSQIETTHLIKYEKIINPLFSKKLNQILVNFDKVNQIDSPNNSFNYLKIDISERKSELNGVVNDFSLGSAISSFNNYGLVGGLLASSFNTSSDYRIKENIIPLDHTFIVDSLIPVTYKNKHTEKQDIGLIAHEVQEIYPFLVNGDKDGEEFQSVNYTGLIAVLIKEIKELKQRVKALEDK